MTGVRHMAWKVAVATGLHCRKNNPKTGYRLAGSHLHGMPLRRPGPSHKTAVARRRSSSLELHHGLVHRHVVAELVLIKRELRTSRWPDCELGDERKKLDEPIGHVGEGLRLAAVVGHLQR